MFSESVYRIQARSWGYQETANGYDRFTMTFEVLGEVDPNNPEAPARPCEAGVRSWSITPTTAQTADWLFEVVMDLGYDGDDLYGLDPDLDGAHDFTGVKFLAKCKHSLFKEKVIEQWSVYQPPCKSLEKERVVALNDRLVHAFRAAKARRAAKASPKPDLPAGDIPF